MENVTKNRASNPVGLQPKTPMLFRAIHKSNLIYNTCWEDPAVDRIALNLTARDRLLVISSAGCNALDYLVAGCGEVHAILQSDSKRTRRA